MIETYRFGFMKIAGKGYHKDLMICKNRVIPGWIRRTGHLLQYPDLEHYIESSINEIIIGQGAFGLMRVDPQCLSKLEKRDICVTASKTSDAVTTFNKSKNKDKILAAFHLTC